MHTPEGRLSGCPVPDFLRQIGVPERLSVRDHLRANYGLYHPPADYQALRAENARRHHLNRPSLIV